VVPLELPQLDWYVPALHARVVAATEQGQTIAVPAGVELPASALLFTGIRPCSWMVSPMRCTMNFVFGDGNDYFLGTAGHCAQVGTT
jgi:hypothetical protein